MKLYIAVLNEVPDFIVPTLVAHSVLGAHIQFSNQESPIYDNYNIWLRDSFKKCVVRVSQKEFDHIAALPECYLGHENKTLNGIKSCAIPIPTENQKLPNVLKFAKLWSPKI